MRGVMEQYIQAPRGRAVVAPPGTSLGQLSPDLFSELATELSLMPLSLVTPWATRLGDVEWGTIERPDTNIMLWALTDAAVVAATEAAYGQPLPFVAILTAGPMSAASVASMWEGTAYGPYETQAVYRQDDQQAVPTIYFLHWGERISMSDAPQRVRPLEGAASKAKGQLVFAAQLPRQPETDRETPAMPFDSALSAQLTLSQASTTQPQASANPATQFCEAHGGRLELVETSGGMTGYCVLPDGTRCEEWALYHGTCGASSLVAPSDQAAVSAQTRTLVIVGVAAVAGIAALAWLTRRQS